jgi:hypothetical protein
MLSIKYLRQKEFVMSGQSFITSTAVYSLLSALLNACGALSFLGLGALGSALPGMVDNAQLTAEEQAAISQASSLSGLLPIFGILFAILAVLLLVDALGLFQKKSWAWTLTVGIYGASVVLSVISWLTGSFSALSLGTTVIAAAVVYIFMTNADVKQILGKI